MAIHRNESRNARLRALADSINDTARMARTTLTLVLLVALYLGVTLISSTDENLLRNGQVVLPQVGVGISVVQSYLFAPPIFVFLHAQALLLLTVLARKVGRYRAVLDEEGVPDARREEYWDWLSGFAFVQLYRTERSILHPPRMLSWLGTNVVPLGLLALVVVSFVRYQSDEITLFHKALFAIDLTLVALFNWRAHPRRWPRLRLLRDWPGFLWRSLWKGTGFTVAIVILWYSVPPDYDDEEQESPQAWEIWRSSDRAPNLPSNESQIDIWSHFTQKAVNLWVDAIHGKNLLDAGPCEWWGYGCRYLDVRRTDLVSQLAEERFPVLPKKEHDSDFKKMRRVYSRPLDLSGRNLRFARLDGVFMPQVSLIRADLSGARLARADLTNADLREAIADGVYAGLVEMPGANLRGARFRGAFLRSALLEGATLSGIHLQASTLDGARLSGSYIREGFLHGVTLRNATLRGADLTGSILIGANFENANLAGADLSRTSLEASYGKPKNWYLMRLPGANFMFRPETGKSKIIGHLRRNYVYWEEFANHKLWWMNKKPIHYYLEEMMKKGLENGLFSKKIPNENDFIYYSATTGVSSPQAPPLEWPKAQHTSHREYQIALTNWTMRYACENVHTALSTLRRWRQGDRPQARYYGSFPDSTIKQKIQESILNIKTYTKSCPGLHDIGLEEIQRILNDL